jgi:pimeloyl-ACP methyl ester carboxylesterase
MVFDLFALLSWTAVTPTSLRAIAFGFAGFLAPLLMSGSVSAQAAGFGKAEEVGYQNAQDGTRLSAFLTLPPGSGPHPGVLVLSIAGTTPLVERLVQDGYAVLIPERRGFVAVEPMLRATFSDLANDVRAALAFMDSRPEIDGAAIGLVAQADDTPPGMLASVASGGTTPLVLLAPFAFSGVETFRRDQRWAAERNGVGPGGLEALDEYVQRIAETVLNESEVYLRRYRLESVRAASSVELPRNAAFPSDERQMDFFASPLWHDRLAFEPDAVFARLRAPVLVLIGADDANTPMDEYLGAVRRSLSASPTPDATVCRIPGRTRHVFTEAGVEGISDWLGTRLASSDEVDAGVSVPLSGCLEDSAEDR